jgi:hypothetical protein
MDRENREDLPAPALRETVRVCYHPGMMVRPALLALLLLAACGESTVDDDAGSSVDAGQDPPMDAGTPADGGADLDAGTTTRPPFEAPEGLGPLTVRDGESDVAADLTGLGTRVAPLPGEPTARTFFLELFGRDAVLTEAPVEFFPGNAVVTPCESPACEARVTSAEGQAMVTLPATGWFTYRVPRAGFGVDAVLETVGHDQVPTDGLLLAVDQTAFRAALAVGGAAPAIDTATVTGFAVDAEGTPMENAVLRVFDDGTGDELAPGIGATGVVYVYWPDASGDGLDQPEAGRTFTGDLGQYAVTNLPSGTPLRVEVWGIASAGADPQLIGCERIAEGRPDAVHVLDVGPLRADGPPGC